MSDRKIYCCKCKIYVGTIRDASLMVGLKYICTACADPDPPKTSYDAEEFTDAFNALFGDIFKQK